MNAKKLQEIEDWLLDHTDEPLSYDVQRKSRNEIMVRGYVPHEYPETDDSAEYFFGEAILYIEDTWHLTCVQWGWETDFTYTMYFRG